MEKKKIICPKCGSNKIGVIFYRIPKMDKMETKKNKEVSMGYIFSPDSPIWHCSKCGYAWK